jgi:hypothetical protein
MISCIKSVADLVMASRGLGCDPLKPRRTRGQPESRGHGILHIKVDGKSRIWEA